MRKTSPAQPTLFPSDSLPTTPTPTRKKTSSPKSVPRCAATASSPQAIRVLAEKSGADGQAWRLSGKHAVAYLRNATLAGELLATEPRHLAKAAMAVYYDRKGKAFAWQVRFDAERWDEIVARLG